MVRGEEQSFQLIAVIGFPEMVPPCSKSRESCSYVNSLVLSSRATTFGNLTLLPCVSSCEPCLGGDSDAQVYCRMFVSPAPLSQPSCPDFHDKPVHWR